jgi:hypothetical protein
MERGTIMPDRYSRRTVLRGVAGAASALALPGAVDGAPAAATAHGDDRHWPGPVGGLDERAFAAFLADQDPVWARLPQTWYEGPSWATDSSARSSTPNRPRTRCA